MALNGSNFDNGIVTKLIQTDQETMMVKRKLELILDVELQFTTAQLNLAVWLDRVARSLINLTRVPKPRIWKRSDNMGQIWWYVYDPVSGLSNRLSSEAQVKAWLALPSSLSDYKETNFKGDKYELSRG